jgi:hypothetical protein
VNASWCWNLFDAQRKIAARQPRSTNNLLVQNIGQTTRMGRGMD